MRRQRCYRELGQLLSEPFNAEILRNHLKVYPDFYFTLTGREIECMDEGLLKDIYKGLFVTYNILEHEFVPEMEKICDDIRGAQARRLLG